MINKKEIKAILKMVLISIFSFYLVFPLRELLNSTLNIGDNLFPQFIVGIIGIIVVAWLFKIE